MVAMRIKAVAHFYRWQIYMCLCIRISRVQHNGRMRDIEIRRGTAFFAGTAEQRTRSRHYISIRHSRVRYRLICHGNDSVFLRDTCNVCTAYTLLGRRFEIEAIRPPHGSAVIYSISVRHSELL